MRVFKEDSLNVYKLKFFTTIPNYRARCLYLGLEPLVDRRRCSMVVFVGDVIQYRIKCPEILSLFYFVAPQGNIIIRESIFIPFHRTNYGAREPITQASKYFNEVVRSGLDLSLPRTAFIYFLKLLYMNELLNEFITH